MGITLNTDVRGKLEAVGALLTSIAQRPAEAMQQFNVTTNKELDEVKRNLLQQQADLQNKLSGQSSQRITQETAAAVTAAEMQIAITEARFQKEAALLDVTQQRRQQALQEDYQAALDATNLNAKERESVERAFAVRAVDLARVTSEERLALARQRITAESAAEDGKIAAEIARQDRMKALGPEAAASANAAIAALNAERTANHAKTAADIIKLDADAAKARAAEEAGYTKIVADERVKQTQSLEQRLAAEARLLQTTLRGRESIITAEQSLVQAQVEGEVLTKQQGYDRLRELQVQQFEIRRELLESEAAEAVRIAEKEGRDIEGIQEQTTLKLQALAVQQQVQQQQLLNQQLEGWRHFSERVQDITADFIFDFVTKGFNSLEETAKSVFNTILRQLSEFAALVATKAIIIPILTAAVGGLAGATGGGTSSTGSSLMDMGSSALTSVALAKQLYQYLGIDTLTGYISSGFETVSQTLYTGVDSLFNTSISAASQASAEALELAATGASAPGGGAAAVGASQLSTGLGVAGGLAAVGGGIYGALNANNTAAQAAYAASAAAGAVYAGGLMAVAAGTAATTGWTGYRLIAAAVLAAIALILDQVISPAGPSLAVGDFKGLNIGTADGKLTVKGDVESEIQKSEKVAEEAAGQVQSALESSLMAATQAMVTSINAIAVDPAALAGSTQDALNRAFADLPTLNSASADNMEEDIKAQMAFLSARLMAELLLPLSEAFTQVSNLPLEEQLLKLPQAAQGMVMMLDGMNQALNQLKTVSNADVLGRIHELESRIADFRSRLIDDTLHALQRAFSGGTSNFEKALQLAVSIPAGMVALHQPLAEVQAMAKAFAPVVSATNANIAQIELRLTPLADLVSDITGNVTDLAQAIADAGDNVGEAIPLFEAMRIAILAQATAATDVANRLLQVNRILLAEQSPVDQQAALQAQLAPLEAAVTAGTATTAQIEQAVALNEQLLALGKETDNLALQQEAIENLTAVQALLEQQLLALTGTTDPQLALVSIQAQALDALKQLNEQMYALYISSTSIEAALGVITPTPAQQGGMLALASGGRVPAMLEPGEMVFPGPMSSSMMGALNTINRGIPRFQVGGFGDGDTVPAMLPGGSFALNRRASGAIRGQGLQSGGLVSSGGQPIIVHQHFNIDLRSAIFRDKRDRQVVIAELQDALKTLTDPSRLFKGR